MALDFDGVDDEIGHGNISAINGAAALTGMCWVKIDTLELEGGFFSKVDFATNVLVLFFGMDSVTTSTLAWASSYTSINGARVASQVVVGEWAHFAFVYDGSGAGNSTRLFLYKDGVALTRTFVGTVPATLLSDAAPFRVGVGEFVGGPTVWTDGQIGHVRLWSAALSAAEIAQEMHSYHPVRTSDLLLVAPYDDGTQARDYSGAGNHGTVTGALPGQAPPVSYGGHP